MLRDPIKTYQRKEIAARRIGRDAKCACGENRPEALIRTNNSITCAACKRRAHGKTTTDDHHFAAKANSAETIAVPVNDHRAVLSTAQYEWPKETLENPRRSPFRKAAAYIRGVRDMIRYLLDKLLWVAELLEATDTYLIKHFGTRWWDDAEITQWIPKDKYKEEHDQLT